jgi:hypothetical protein
MMRFLERSHEGWKMAQIQIIERICRNLELNETLKTKLNKCHIQKDLLGKKAISDDLGRSNSEIVILRRMLDYIPWAIFGEDLSSIRRMAVKGGGKNLTLETIGEALETLNTINRNPKVIAIANDVTTFIHIGDLLIADLNDGKIQFVELKRGEKNVELSKAAYTSLKNPEFEKSYSESLSDKDKAHFNRSKRQAVRGKNLLQNLNGGTGIDNFTGRHFRAVKASGKPSSYSAELLKAFEKLSDKRWSLMVVDECLFVGLYKDFQAGVTAFPAWMAGIDCKGPILNITSSFIYAQVRPFAATMLPVAILNQLFRGELFMVVSFDIFKFLNQARSIFGDIVYLRKKSEISEMFKEVETLEQDGYVMAVKIKGDEVILGPGFLDRILYDFCKPLHSLALTIDSLSEVRSKP